MIFYNQKISMRQTNALFIAEVFAAAVVFMPSMVWNIMGGKGLLAAAIAVGGLFISVFIIRLVYRRNCDSFGAAVHNALGKKAGNILLIAFWVKIMVVSGLWLREFSGAIHSTMLGSIPYQFIAAVTAVICFYMAQKDIEVRGRTAEIFIIIMALLFIPVLLVAALGADYTNLLPFKGFKAGDTLKASLVVFASLGSADYLLFLYPKTNIGKGGMVPAVAIVGVLLICTMTVVYSVFGSAVADKSWPVLNMMDTVDFPGAFIERQDVFMIGFWILSFYIYISGGITYGTYLMEEATGKTNYLLSGIIIYAAAVLKSGFAFDISRVMFITTPVFLVAVPVILLIFSGRRGRQ